MQNMRIALVQFQAIAGEAEENLQKIEHFTARASWQKADIVCFPELCVQGYDRGNARRLAGPVPGPVSENICRLAGKYNLIILVGTAEASPPGKPFITQLVACPDGSLYKYRKTHTGKSESPYFRAGDEIPVFNAGKGAFGIEICWDLHFPEVSTILSLKGAEIIFAPHASPDVAGSRRDIWLKYLPARAYDNSVYIAACNLVGNSGAGPSFSGGLLVIDPKGNIVAESFGEAEEMLVVDLDKDLINAIRQKKAMSMRQNFFLSFRRPELYGDLSKPHLFFPGR